MKRHAYHYVALLVVVPGHNAEVGGPSAVGVACHKYVLGCGGRHDFGQLERPEHFLLPEAGEIIRHHHASKFSDRILRACSIQQFEIPDLPLVKPMRCVLNMIAQNLLGPLQFEAPIANLEAVDHVEK